MPGHDPTPLKALYTRALRLIYEGRYKEADYALRWSMLHRPMQSEPGARLPSTRAVVVGLLNLRSYLYVVPEPEHRDHQSIGTVITYLECFVEAECYTPIQYGLLHLRAGQLTESTGRYHEAIDHYRAAAAMFGQAEAVLDQALALMLQGRVLRGISPKSSARLLARAIKLLFRQTWRRSEAHELYYIAHAWSAQTAAARGKQAHALWHRSMTALAAAPLHARQITIPEGVQNAAFFPAYVETFDE